MVPSRSIRGVTLVDAIVGSALVLVIFLALVGLMRASLLVASLAKVKAGATAVANTQLEYIRSLPYDSVGTVGGIPAGEIAQYSTTTQNSVAYGLKTFIEYVDDPADGTDAADTNTITTDYKQVKVTVSYLVKGQLRQVSMVSNYAPPSIETATNGGTLKVIVVNATGAPVAGAQVRVVNASTSPTIDVTTFSDVLGEVLLGGAATSTQYQVYVSKTGYSSAQTYARDGTNQNPNPGYLTVVKNATTAGTFAIDALASFTMNTYFPIAATTTLDAFNDTSLLASQTNTQINASELTLLDNGATGYSLSGSADSVAISPPLLVSWVVASTTTSSPSGTQARVRVYDGSGYLLPDAEVPGNSSGFDGPSIDLTQVSTTSYPTLSLHADLSTNATTTTPTIAYWSITALVGPTPAPNVPFTFTGAKTIGTTGAGAAIYKTVISSLTSGLGTITLSPEWDSYLLSVTGYDVVDACYAPSYALSPASVTTASLYIDTQTANSMLVAVRDTTGAYVSGASVTLSRTGYSSTVQTSSCGAAYFGSITADNAYSVQIQKTGYTTTTYTNVTVGGQTFYSASFP
ncbi:MAG: carboxypeptidase-like regulatory domain-containing protein [Patescibacteria group bacterium]